MKTKTIQDTREYRCLANLINGNLKDAREAADHIKIIDLISVGHDQFFGTYAEAQKAARYLKGIITWSQYNGEAPQAPTDKDKDKLSYDGKGINGSDQYRTRLATFTPEATAVGHNDIYGHLFAGSPGLVNALMKFLVVETTTAPDGMTVVVNPKQFVAACKQARAALNNAGH